MRHIDVGCVVRRHGAWLAICHDPQGEATPDDEFDCASNREVAKRLCREMAESFGYGGPWAWREDEYRELVLYASSEQQEGGDGRC